MASEHAGIPLPHQYRRNDAGRGNRTRARLVDLFRSACLLLMMAAPPGTSGQTSPPGAEHDVTSYELVYQVPGMSNVTVRKDIAYKTAGGTRLSLDLYAPPGSVNGSRPPAVVFVNGVGNAPGARLKEWGQYRSWARLMAASGYVAITFDSLGPDPTGDIRDVFTYLRANAGELGLDPKNIGVWACSANVSRALPYVMEGAGPEIRCAVMYYGVADVGRLRQDFPVLFVRAGRDRKALNDRIDRLLARVAAGNLPWTVVNVPDLHHAFDCLDDNDESRRVIRQTVEYFDRYLRPQPASGPPSLARQALVHWFSQEWEEAATAYARYLERNPEDGVAYTRLALSQLQLKKYPEAVKNLQQAIKFGQATSANLYNIACAYALAGETQQALGFLERAVGAGFDDRQHVASDPDLESLRGHDRFKALLERVK